MMPMHELNLLLQTASSSAQRRTVCSRACYVSYRTLIGVCGPVGFDPDHRDPTAQRRATMHQRLFEFLRQSDATVQRNVGRTRIQRLFDLRIKADYRFRLPATNAEAQDAVHLAQDIHDWIADAGLPSQFSQRP